MSWFLLILFAGNAQFFPVSNKAQCEELKLAVLASYGKGTALVDVRCVSTNGDTPKK